MISLNTAATDFLNYRHESLLVFVSNGFPIFFLQAMGISEEPYQRQTACLPLL
jgi:hypothetical protein